jgi:hypothetical protein
VHADMAQVSVRHKCAWEIEEWQRFDVYVDIVEAESAAAAISLVWSHELGRGSLHVHVPLRPELSHRCT